MIKYEQCEYCHNIVYTHDINFNAFKIVQCSCGTIFKIINHFSQTENIQELELYEEKIELSKYKTHGNRYMYAKLRDK